MQDLIDPNVKCCKDKDKVFEYLEIIEVMQGILGNLSTCTCGWLRVRRIFVFKV